MKRIMITGADGFLGGKMIKKLVDSTDYSVIAVSSFAERIPAMLERESIRNTDKMIIMSSEEMLSSSLEDLEIAGVVHFAFSRAGFPNRDIADSLDYCLRVYNKIVDTGIQNSIYISSQSVYGDYPELRKEDIPPAPNSIYAMAKYAGEKIIEACYRRRPDLQYSILRLDNVIQSQNLVKALCKNAKEKGVLKLTGGKQVFSYIDADEVPNAIYALLTSQNKWKHVYNVGADKMQATLIDVAEAVKHVFEQNGIPVEIVLTENDTQLWAGMKIDSFITDTGWYPKLKLEKMVSNIFKNI